MSAPRSAPTEVLQLVNTETMHYADKQLVAAGDWHELLSRRRVGHNRRLALSAMFTVFYAARIGLFWGQAPHAAMSAGFAALGLAFCCWSRRQSRRYSRALEALEGSRA